MVAPTMRRPRRGAIVAAMSATEPLRLCVDVDRRVSPVSGRVTAPGASELAFAGWTELFAALQAAIAQDQEEPIPTTRGKH